MRCCGGLVLQELPYANSLAYEEEQHAAGRCQEEKTTSKPFAHESGQNRPEQIPDGKKTIDEQLYRSEVNVPSAKEYLRCILGW